MTHTSVRDILSDERSRCAMLAVARASTRRLHRDRRGNITVLFLFLGLIFYCSLAMIWNTGTTAAAKIEVQTAADAAAYSSAVWTSRAINLTTGTNMMILRNATANVWALGAVGAFVAVPIGWAIFLARQLPKCAALTVGAPACVAAVLAMVAREIPSYAHFVPEAWDGIEEGLRLVTGSNAFTDRIEELHDFQVALRNATSDAIEEQRTSLEEYYGVDLRLTRPDGGSTPGKIDAPLKDGNYASFIVPFGLRLLREYSNDSWYKSLDFKMLVIGKPLTAKNGWLGGAAAGLAVTYLGWGSKHSVLETQDWFLERDWNADDRDVFTIVATARGQVNRDGFIAPGLFGDPVAPNGEIIAYAQAETNLGIDGFLDFPGQPGWLNVLTSALKVYPYRVWTPWGWQWQPRLTRGDYVDEALQVDTTLSGWYSPAGVTSGDLDDVSLH